MIYKKFIHIIFLLICLNFVQQSLAQEVRVIDNKGTITQIRNNKVTTSATAPTTPLEGDVWFDTSNTNNVSKIFDDVNGWIVIDLDNVTSNTTAPATKNIGDVWFDTTTKVTRVFNGTTWSDLGGTNSTFDVQGTDLEITDSKGTLSVPLSDLSHTGTIGSVFFAGTDEKPTENNSELFWDNTNNRLGIGTDNPTNKLEVSGVIGTQRILNYIGTVTEPSYSFKNDPDTGMFRTNLVDEFGFSAGGIEAIHIEEDSNITLVTIKNDLALDGKLFDINDEAGTNGQILSSTTTGTDWVDASDFSWSITGNSGTDSTTNFAGTIDNQDFVLKSNNTEKLRLLGDKNQVLINQAATYSNHPLVIRANGTELLAYEDNTATPKWHWTLLSDALSLNYIEPDTGLPDPPGFTNTFDYRLYLKDDGNVGINTNNPTERLHINGGLRLTEAFKDANNEAGTNGQILSTTVTGTDWVDASNYSWSVTGNSGTDSSVNFAGTTDNQDFVLKSNNTEKLRLLGDKNQVLINQAPTFNNHPLVIRASGNDVLAFQDNTGTPKWHWNLLNNGLNFVESNVADYRLYLENGGNIGIDTNLPTERLDINGKLRIRDITTTTTDNNILTATSDGVIEKKKLLAIETDNQLELGANGGAYLGPTVYTGSFIIEYNNGNSDANITLPFEPSQVTFVAHANVDSLNSSGSNANNNSNTIINSYGTMNGFANATTGTLVQQVIYVGGSGNSINDIGWFSSSSHVIGVRYGNQNGDNLGVIEGALSFTASGFDIAVNYDSTGLTNANRNLLRAEKLVVLYTAYK